MIVGKCSNCGGNVVKAGLLVMHMFPPPPTCQACGATQQKGELPVVPMNPPVPPTRPWPFLPPPSSERSWAWN